MVVPRKGSPLRSFSRLSTSFPMMTTSENRIIGDQKNVVCPLLADGCSPERLPSQELLKIVHIIPDDDYL